jgi:hypothetical protein
MRQERETVCRTRKLQRPAVLGLLLILAAPGAHSYSVLTHEAIIDSAWDSALKPLLLRRFPAATPDELKQAHAYAYGGCIIQDLGYYPFGSKFFSDLTHYVRSGDFILNLIRDSQDLDEYAFALGALSHYAADNNGHSIAVNLAVLCSTRSLAGSSENMVTYADDPFTHAKTEFAFDVFQAARGRYASAAYKSFIGFEVAKPVLQRAFEDTYGMRLEKVFLDVDLAIGSYRRAVGTILPAMTRVAWQIKKQEIRKDAPSRYPQGLPLQFIPFQLPRRTGALPIGGRASGRNSWRPCCASCRKVGPLRPLAFPQADTPETEKMYMASFNSTIDRYRELLAEQNAGGLKLPNDNLDVGTFTAAGKYKLMDATYSQLLTLQTAGPLHGDASGAAKRYPRFLPRPWRFPMRPRRTPAMGQGTPGARSIAAGRHGSVSRSYRSGTRPKLGHLHRAAGGS